MIYKDRIYGSAEITSPAILALTNTNAMQRLKSVLQHGITALIGITQPTTRFEHSVGAMLFVERMGGDEAEQIAALLHDVSHTAFSHVIDHVFGDPNSQSYHDEQKEAYIAGTDIPATLAQFGYDWRDFLREEDYPILEQPSPRLCADRVDYFLRDAQEHGLLSNAEITTILAHLIVHGGRIVCDDASVARLIGERFMAADDFSWSDFREVGLYELTAQAIKRGLTVGALTMGDIWGTDEPAWRKLHQYPDGELRRLLALINPNTGFVWDEENPHFRVKTKIRTVDPDVLIDDQLAPLSYWDPEFDDIRSNYLQRKQGVWPMRIIANADS